MMLERPIPAHFQNALRKRGVTGGRFSASETRLDNVVYRLGLANTAALPATGVARHVLVKWAQRQHALI